MAHLAAEDPGYAVAHVGRRKVEINKGFGVVQPVIDVGAQYGALSARFPAADLFYPGALH